MSTSATPSGVRRVSLPVVVPAFSEERRLPDTLADLTAYLRLRDWEWEIRVELPRLLPLQLSDFVAGF